jgi:hypothetical protein
MRILGRYQNFLDLRLGPCALACASSTQEIDHGHKFVQPLVLERSLGSRSVEGDDA